jgi:hypothetical protein
LKASLLVDSWVPRNAAIAGVTVANSGVVVRSDLKGTAEQGMRRVRDSIPESMVRLETKGEVFDDG